VKIDCLKLGAAGPLAAVQVHRLESAITTPGKDPILETAGGAKIIPISIGSFKK